MKDLKSLYIKTPLIEETSPVLSGKKLFYKMEAFQPCGSFKLRGMEFACRDALEKGAHSLLSSSGGNAGLAVAYVGRQWNVPVTVVLPETTPESVSDELRRMGSLVVIHGSAWDESDEYCLELCAREPDTAYIPPFDAPKLWEGHSTMVDELVSQCPEQPDAIVLSVGGGGLMNGVLEGLERNGWSDTAVLAVETFGADSLYQSYKAGRLITLPDITSVAKSLGAKRVAAKTLENALTKKVFLCRAEDAAAIRACVRFADEHRVLVEPACGVSLSVVYDGRPELDGYDNIVVIVCGGSKVNLRVMEQWDK